MFETPTQKNFKKQMKKIEREKKLRGNADIYGSIRRTVEFDKPISTGGGSYSRVLAITITLILFIGPYLLSKSGFNFDFKLPFLNNNQQVKVVASNNEKVLPLKCVKSLEELEKIFVKVNKDIQRVHNFYNQNKIRNSYKSEILQGITECKKCKEKLNKINREELINSLYNITDEYLVDAEWGFHYYLSFINGNNNDLQEAIQYFNKANQHSRAYRQEFINILDKHDYKYEILEDGNIRYWFKA